MSSFLYKFSKFLTDYTPVIVILAAVIAFFYQPLFSWVVSYKQTIILGFIMLSMGLTLSKEDMVILASRPLDILIGTIAQFTIMPLIALTLVSIFNIDSAIVVGIILVACCPGGVSSNIMSYLCKGDVAYSVGMTTVNTMIAPIVTPTLVYLLAGERVDVDVLGMFLDILIVTIFPVSIGFFCNMYLGKNKTFQSIRVVMPALSVIALALIVGGVVAIIHDKLIIGGIALFLWTFLLVFCHNTMGYIVGYFFGYVFKFNRKKKRTLSIEVGMQNAGLATNLASTFFIVTNPMSVLPCAISCVWHSISGTLIATLFKMKDTYFEKQQNIK